MKEEEKYEFNLDDPASWSQMPKPLLSERFIKETNAIGGVNAHGEPRFKWVWGMSEQVYVESDGTYPSGWYLKYQLCDRKTLAGFEWTENGKKRFAENQRDIPKHILAPTLTYRIDQIGTPRWILEEWHEESDCNGVYDQAGYYFHRKIVRDDLPENPETFLRPYREPNQKDLEILAGYVQLTANLSQQDIEKGVERDRQREAEASDKLKKETQEELTESFVEIITDMPRLSAPSKAVVQKAWNQLEAKK